MRYPETSSSKLAKPDMRLPKLKKPEIEVPALTKPEMLAVPVIVGTEFLKPDRWSPTLMMPAL
ncbi:Uncharacterised protein [Mycobacterium tuberculosis]|uniref:Uncharacterized protein n=1 Tax=Mycobacterium tuberculosis TaxID=1773 RepID=A0A654U119_MYCTX|nr:Uncharacterised protein [Mycobacterium tuberculosis]CNM11713.1 Uncharacterised protein [Mycobacterium tuberculosis]